MRADSNTNSKQNNLYTKKKNVCHLSCVTCHVSPVMCHLQSVTNTNIHRPSPCLLPHFKQQAGSPGQNQKAKKTKIAKPSENETVSELANNTDSLFDQRSQVHQEAWFPGRDSPQTLPLIGLICLGTDSVHITRIWVTLNPLIRVLFQEYRLCTMRPCLYHESQSIPRV